VILPPIIKTKDGSRWYLKEELSMYSRLVKEHEVKNGMAIENTGFIQAASHEVEKLRAQVQKMSVVETLKGKS